MSFNRIAIYGHRGWASSAIAAAMIASGAPIKVLYRPGSDISSLPDSVPTVAVDLDDQGQVVAALQDVDIVISLVGHEGVTRQHGLVKAIPETGVRLFVPSDLAARYDEQGLRIRSTATKFALATPAMGVDRRNNRLLFSGDSERSVLNMCTRSYVAAAYASIFATTPIEDLQGRTIALSEFRATGSEIATALTELHGSSTATKVQFTESTNAAIESALATGSPFALAFYCRKIWGTGQQAHMVGLDFWDVPGYNKASLRNLIARGQLQEYRQLPPAVLQFVEGLFEQCM
ncbi:hypothetical protein BJX62DRAFT_245003 [Aspergillus germanicus]